MSDINKMITELEELLTRTEPKPLTLHLKSYVAMRNYLPELLHYAKIGSEPCPDCEDVVPRMEEAEGYANELTKVLLEHFPETEGDSDYSGEAFYSANEFDRVISVTLRELRERAEKVEAELKQAKAERDVLANQMAVDFKRVRDEFHQRFGGAEDECYPDYYLRWAAQEAAKRKSGEASKSCLTS